MSKTLIQNKKTSRSQFRSQHEIARVRRRQFSSCDQCRKGKRACDINASREETNFDFSPCSNCSKTGKVCTVEWLKSRDQVPQKKGKSSTVQLYQSEAEAEIQLWDQCSLNEHEEVVAPVDDVWNLPLSPASYIYQQNSEFEKSVHATSSYDGQSVLGEPQVYLARDVGPYRFDENTCFSTDGSISTSRHSTASSMHEPGGIEMEFEHSVEEQLQERLQKNPNHSRRSKRRSSTTSRRISPFPLPSSLMTADPSSANIEFRLASSTHKSFISGNLLKIYHDSMENALSCWLTEKTCPYDVEVQGYVRNAHIPKTSMETEWGPLWSNRICERVCNLDKSCGSLRGQLLSPSEDRAVDKALRKTIMAFATQWAYSSRRSSAQYPGNDGLHSWREDASNRYGVGQDATYYSEFDRTMQEVLWHEARDSLQDTAEITSFRLVFANIIFALTQKPLDLNKSLSKLKIGKAGMLEDLDGDDPTKTRNHQPTTWANLPEDSTNGIPNPSKPFHDQDLLEDVLELDGPPVFLERALRQMFSYRRKLEKLESRQRTNIKKTPGQQPEIPRSSILCGPLGVSERQTFNLLFWLAIMFDTLSAAINKRPLVVSDEDSDILRDESLHSAHPGSKFDQFGLFSDVAHSLNNDCSPQSDESEIWGEFFFQKDTISPKETIARWPCSYEVAAATLCDAAPIKVVLFRRVTRLQTLLSRRTRPERLEIAISEALRVQDYWNTNYEPFFRDCISYHETLPPRIQSWYIVLAGHWHLAGLLLADLIEEIDDLQAGLESNRIMRKTKRLIENLRLHNAFAVSDLGRCSCPNPDSSFSRAREFHSAVNNGALLTEPWTEVLIQSFSKACSVILNMFPTSRTEENFNLELLTDRSESCVRALWYLGRKSDIASLASNVLSDALKKKISDLRRDTEPSARGVHNTFDEATWGNADFSYDSLENFLACV